MALSQGDQKRGASKARVQSRPETRASCARRMHNNEDEVSEDEGSGGVIGAVQDYTEGSYEPRPTFDAPARESWCRGAKTAAKVAPAAQEMAATVNGYEWRHQQDFRNEPEPSPWEGTGGYGDPPLADNESPDEGGGGPVNQLPQRQESSTCKVVGCSSPH
jgi:hypothetical protein